MTDFPSTAVFTYDQPSFEDFVAWLNEQRKPRACDITPNQETDTDRAENRRTS